MTWTFERLAGPIGDITEGPAWDGGGLLFTDISNNQIMRYDPQTGGCRVFRSGTNGANGLMLDGKGRLYACEGKGAGRRVVRYESDGDVTVLADRFEGKRLNSPNDLAIDASGRVWFTDPGYGLKDEDRELDHDSVYRLTPPPAATAAWTIERVTFDTTKPNGLLISAAEDVLYVAQSDHGDTARRELRAYPIRADGTLDAYRVLHDFGAHRGIDGMCLDPRAISSLPPATDRAVRPERHGLRARWPGAGAASLPGGSPDHGHLRRCRPADAYRRGHRRLAAAPGPNARAASVAAARAARVAASPDQARRQCQSPLSTSPPMGRHRRLVTEGRQRVEHAPGEGVQVVAAFQHAGDAPLAEFPGQLAQALRKTVVAGDGHLEAGAGNGVSAQWAS